MTESTKTVRTRFAPSPTGSLHIGGVRTAIFNWLFANQAGGKFILRIENTDRTRSTEESIEEITNAMLWLGLDWDEGPFRQSERLDIYQEHANKLLESGKAYKCYVTPEELKEKRKEAQSKGEVLRYKREWADLNAGPNKLYSIRFKVPRTGVIDQGHIYIEDLLRGTIIFDPEDIDDFVILKQDGYPTYNFAAVVDDAEMKITHVIRGDDHLINTPRQYLLYHALSLQDKMPIWVHVSMILGADNKRLSKRHGATSVMEYKKQGYLPQAMFNFLVRLGWSYGNEEIFSKKKLLEIFTLDNLGKSPAIFNTEKLDWLNAWYIRNEPLEDVARHVEDLLREKGQEVKYDDKFLKIVKELRERAKTLLDIARTIDYFYAKEIEYEEKAANKFLTPEILPVLKDIEEKFKSEFLEQNHAFNTTSVHAVFDKMMKERDLGLGKLAQPMRVALTGGTVSPGIFEVIDILGRETVLERLRRAIEYISDKKSDPN